MSRALGLLWLLVMAMAAGAARGGIYIEATVLDGLRVVEGTLRVDGLAGYTLVDPLASLPQPADDRTALRTWPRGPNLGQMDIERLEEGRYRFRSMLPVRYGALGFVPAKGLFANGGWYPQVLVDGQPPLQDWDVEVAFPDGVLGVLGNETGGPTGRFVLRWSGRAERVALAALCRGMVETVPWGGGHLTVVATARSQRRWRAHLATLGSRWPEGLPPDLVVVEAPLMRRLVRTGPGVLFLADRAFRLSPGLGAYHRDAVYSGLLQAGLPVADHQERATVADILMRAQPAAQVQGVLRWFSWLPQVDDLLYDGSTPYVSELLGQAFAGDPLADDLLELLVDGIPGAVVARQWEDLLGPGSGAGLADGLLQGLSLERVSGEAGLPAAQVAAWRGPVPAQDYRLQVEAEADGSRIRVQRQSLVAGPEPLTIEIDGERQLWWAQAANDAWQTETAAPARQVTLDPDGHVAQADRANDRWPTRWTVVLSAFPMVWNVSSGNLEAFGAVRLRRQHDTRNYFDFGAIVDEVNRIEGYVAFGRAMGPLQDLRRRPLRLYPWLSLGWLDPDFRPTDTGTSALGTGLTFVWDTVVDDLFPLRGHELVLAAETGMVPGSEQTWSSLRGSFTGISSPHPRLAVAAQARVGWAGGQVEHHLLILGGSEDLRCLAADQVVGTLRTVGMAELRWAPLRHVSVPVLLGWLDEWQISVGAEAGWLQGAHWDDPALDQESQIALAGATLGSTVVVDILGARPTLMGLLGAMPVASQPQLEVELPPRLYVTWWQAF